MTESVINNTNGKKSNEDMEDDACYIYEILDDDLEEKTEVIHDVSKIILINKTNNYSL